MTSSIDVSKNWALGDITTDVSCMDYTTSTKKNNVSPYGRGYMSKYGADVDRPHVFADWVS